MKKYFTLLAFVALMLPLSCNKQQDGKEEGKDDNNTTPEVVMTEIPATQDVAMLIEFEEGNCPSYEEDGNKYDILSIEFTETSIYFLRRLVTETKAVGDIETIMGLFTEENGLYTLDGFGTVEVTTKEGEPAAEAGKTEEKEVTVTPDTSSSAANGTVTGETYSGTATVTGSTAGSKNSGNSNNGGSNDNSGANNGSTGNQQEQSLICAWSVDNCIMTVYLENGNKAEKGFKGCDLQEIAKYAADNGVSQLANKTNELSGHKVKYVSFTGNGTFNISFTGVKTTVGCTYKEGPNKTLSFDFANSANPFFKGTASGSYDFPEKDKATIIINSSYGSYSGSLTLNCTAVYNAK